MEEEVIKGKKWFDTTWGLCLYALLIIPVCLLFDNLFLKVTDVEQGIKNKKYTTEYKEKIKYNQNIFHSVNMKQ